MSAPLRNEDGLWLAIGGLAELRYEDAPELEKLYMAAQHRPITFGSLFAGIGGFDKGFEDSGMRCLWQVEKDAAARSVLMRHYPDVPKYDDVCTVGRHNLTPVDLICGGFPCQDLSVAGNRAGLSGARSGLFYEMTRITDELRPAYLVWENVPGLLSSDDGRDFARVLLELDRIGYAGCWTVLDAQFFGVAQRRQRVFGVFARRDIGAARCAEILSLAARLPWNTETRRAPRARVAAAVAASAGHHGRSSPRGDGTDNVTATLNSGGNNGGFRTEPGEHIVTVIKGAANGRVPENGPQYGEVLDDGTCYTLNCTEVHAAASSFGVRRLTPRECERLQGFDDGWTAGQPDSSRYRQLGNAVNRNVARWLGAQIVRHHE